jgi:hypothetical protein
MNDAQPIALAQAAESVSKNAVRQGLHELAENENLWAERADNHTISE